MVGMNRRPRELATCKLPTSHSRMGPVRILEMPVISATNLRHFCPLPWNPDAESLNHVCLIAVGGSRFELLSSIHLEIIDNWPTDDFLNRVTVG